MKGRVQEIHEDQDRDLENQGPERESYSVQEREYSGVYRDRRQNED